MGKILSIFILFVFGFISVMAQEETITIDKIHIEGNSKTKNSIILRELMFEQDSSYSTSQWLEAKEKSIENLINTSLFNTASINLSKDSTATNTVNIKVIERWYLWPIPQVDIDERNFNVWWETKNLKRLSAGVYLTKENFRGRMEEVKLLFMAGYNQQFGLSYDAPYINKKKTFGLGAEVVWTGRHEVNNATLSDKQAYYKNVETMVQRDLLAAIHFRYRKNYYVSHLIQFRYKNYYFSDSLMANSTNYSWKGLKQLPYFGIYYKIKNDHRDYKPYPLHGYYIDLEVFKNGFGLLDNQGMDLWDIKTTMRKYWQLNDRFYFAGGLMGKISNYEEQPYFLQKSLGYSRDFVRGYEYYVIDGSKYAVVKTNLKWAVIPQNKIRFNFIKTEKFNTVPYAFYLNLFYDAGYVSENKYNDVSNQLPGSFLSSLGLGIDFTTYYDKVARFEIARNNLGEIGFFLHFIAPI